MFGTAGIRGLYGKDITEALAESVSNIFAANIKTLVVGRDIRKSGISLLAAVSAGARTAGANVIDLGIVPTPTVALATRKHKCRGIVITASHNPPEYNGLKFIENTHEIYKSTENAIEAHYRKGTTNLAEKKGTFTSDLEIVSDHKSLIFGLVDRAAITKRAPKIILDCNGAGAVISPSLLTELGCKVTNINSSTSEFSRPSEPTEKNVSELISLVRAQGADLGIAHDGDADRCIIVDDKGEILPLDVQLSMMIESELSAISNHKGEMIVSTVEASLTIRETVERCGGKIMITPVGSSHVSEALERTGAYFGGEPCGEYIFRDGVHMPDGIIAAAKFVELFCKKGQLSQLRSKYPQHFIAREKFQLSAEHGKNKYEIVRSIAEKIKIDGEIRNDDGLRVDEKDGWFLIRASGTEPIIRLTLEYRTKTRLEKRKKELESLILTNSS